MKDQFKRLEIGPKTFLTQNLQSPRTPYKFCPAENLSQNKVTKVLVHIPGKYAPEQLP
jgi:hypothetical protein